MKILVLFPQLPFPLDRGVFQRNYHLLSQLSQRHELDLLALDEGGERGRHAAKFQTLCRRVEIVPFNHPAWPPLWPDRLLNPLPTTIAHWTIEPFATALDGMLANGNYDLVYVCDIVLAQYFVGQREGIPIIVDRSRVDLQFQLTEHRNLELSWKQQLLRGENYLKLWRFERAVLRRASMQTVCGPDDVAFVRRYLGRDTPVEVVGNGVDLDFFHSAAAGEHRSHQPTVLFCGAMDYSANVDALAWYFDNIHEAAKRRTPDLEVWLVGKNPTPQVRQYGQLPGVHVTGEVTDVRPYYRRCWAQIVPLRIGCGTRLKIPESMAMGTPVVSTSIGAQGLDLKPDREICLADTAEAFVAQMTRILHDTDFRTSLETQGGKTVRERWSWKHIGDRLNASLLKAGLVGQPAPVHPLIDSPCQPITLS